MATPSSTRRTALDNIKFKPASIRPSQIKLDESLDAPTWRALLLRVRREFDEMPGLSLTLPQASRLFDLPEATCSLVLLQLVEGGQLCQRHDGRYALRSSPAA